jgi:hypothetical protein
MKNFEKVLFKVDKCYKSIYSTTAKPNTKVKPNIISENQTPFTLRRWRYFNCCPRLLDVQGLVSFLLQTTEL